MDIMLHEVVTEPGADQCLMDPAVSNTPNIFVQKCCDLIAKDDFHTFRKVIKSPFFCNKKEIHPDITILLESILNHPDKLDNKITTATYISFIWERSKLWKDKILNNQIVQHVTSSTNIRTLFSLLMFDWHNQDQCGEDVCYYLDSKFKQFKDATNESLFTKLYETIDADNSSYRHVCLRIIYQFLDELHNSNDRKSFDKLEQVMRINEVFEMRDKEFKKKILKVFAAYWHHKSDDNDPLRESENVKLIGRLQDISPFFALAFMLKDKLTSTFEKEFQIYVEKCKRNHGFYYEAKLKADNRLLLYIAEQNNLNQIRSFIFRKCPFNEVNATPLTNLQEISNILHLNIYPWTGREDAIYKEMEAAVDAIKKANREHSYYLIEPETKQINNEQRTDGEENEHNSSEKWMEHRKEIDKQLKIFRRCLTRTNGTNLSYFWNFKTARNLLFERKFEKPSLFERILSSAGMKEVIELAFEMCDTLKNEYILQTQNPHGKRLINYVIDSKDCMNLIGFIIPNHSNKVSLLTRRHFVKTQNRQHKQIAGISLFEKFMFIRDKRLREKFFDVPFCLLEELNEIHNIKTQTDIDKLLKFLYVASNVADDVTINREKVLELYANCSDVVIADAKHTMELLESGNNRDKIDLEYDLNKLLRYTLKYWQPNDKCFTTYTTKLLSTKDPMLEMIIQIIRGEVDKFKGRFDRNVKKLFNRYVWQYQNSDENERLIQEDMFILFRIAIYHGRDDIVEWILDYENFETLPFEFPRHNKATQHNYFATQKLLEHGYELSHEGVPPYWISEQVLSNFLDSRIENYDENLVRMDMSCLMNSNDRKFKISDKRDVSDELLFNEHTGSLNYILKNEEIKCLLQHPVVSTYINIKTYKFQFIHRLNFFFFLFAFMLPFVFLINIHTSDANEFSLFQDVFLFICVLSTIILGFRECMQLVWFYRSPASYFSDFDNQVELLMIVLSWSVIFSILTLNIQESIDLFSFISTLLIIVSTITMMTILPFSTVPLYMRMLRNVSVTFFKFFSFFVFIVIAFSVSFFVIFKPKRLLSDRQNAQLTNSTEDGPFDNDDEVYQNFGTLMGSFFKTLLMLSGEYTIEPFTLSLTKMIVFFIFVITSFIVFNLIIALAITDVKELTDEAEALDLHHKLVQFIKSSAKWKQFYDKFKLKTTKLNQLNFVNRWTVKAIRFFLRNHYYVHKLDTVYLNLQTLEVWVKVNKRFESPLSTQFGSNSKFIMSAETFQRVKQILRTREEKYFREIQKARKP